MGSCSNVSPLPDCYHEVYIYQVKKCIHQYNNHYIIATNQQSHLPKTELLVMKEGNVIGRVQVRKMMYRSSPPAPSRNTRLDSKCMVAFLINAQFLPALRTVPFGAASRNLGEVDTGEMEPFLLALQNK
jgi:hypothetical protein